MRQFEYVKEEMLFDSHYSLTIFPSTETVESQMHLYANYLKFKLHIQILVFSSYISND